MIFITGDVHRNFNGLIDKIFKYNLNKDDTIIILGDVGINYFLDDRDYQLKKTLSFLPCTFFCIQGNHEERPFNIKTYKEVEYHGAKAYIEEEFPNLIFAKDGEVYDFYGLKTLVIGGAYSVDKKYRIQNSLHWFKDEQPSDEIKKYVESKIKLLENKVDIVLTHTVPYKYRPIEVFLGSIDQSEVDETTELWLDKIEDNLDYKKWYAGHFHINKKIDKLHILFGDLIEMSL